MTREQILEWCRLASAIGAVKHEEFADYVVALPQRKKIGDEWTTVETPYMAVDGKLAMANEDHRRQAKRLDFGPPQVLVDNGEQLTLLVTVTSEIYGTRHGIATSRRSGGTAAEREFPWEVAETSAIGRALSAMGYGLFPGSGLASAEDMLRVGSDRRDYGREERREPTRSGPGNGHGSPRVVREEPAESQPAAATQPPLRPRSPVSAVQRRKMIELYVKQHGGTEAEATHALDRLFVESFKHGLGEASYEEGGHIMATLLAAQKAR